MNDETLNDVLRPYGKVGAVIKGALVPWLAEHDRAVAENALQVGIVALQTLRGEWIDRGAFSGIAHFGPDKYAGYDLAIEESIEALARLVFDPGSEEEA